MKTLPVCSSVVAACCLILLSSGTALGWFGSDLSLVDKDVGADIGQIAKEICETSKGFDRQLSRISTVVKLDDYFHTLPAEDKLSECGKRYHDSLHSLRELLELNPGNVCSEAKISAIESFHHNFVSESKEDVAARSGANLEAPHMLRLFFVHYAMEVSATCKRTLLNNLEVEVREQFSEEDYKFTGDMKALTKTLMPDDKVDEFEDVVLTDDLFYSASGDDEQLEEIIDPLTGDHAKLFVKTRDTGAVTELKRKCYLKFRPYYEQLILPIIRLDNLGYSNTGAQFQRELEELRNNELARRWYAITQICEAVRPVLYLQDESLVSQEVVAVTKEEAQVQLAKLQIPKIQEQPVDYEPTTNTMEGVDQLDSVSSIEAQQMVKKVDAKTTAQDRSIRKIMIKLVKRIKNLPKKIFFSYKCQLTDSQTCPISGYQREDLGAAFEKSFSSMSDEELMNLEGASGKKKGIQRNKYRSRKNDPSLIDLVNARDQVMRTKSWGQIFHEWKEAILPSKLNFAIGCFIFFVVLGLVIAIPSVLG